MKHLKLTILLTILMSMVGARAFAHDIEVVNADGKTIRTEINNQTKDLTLDEAGVYQARMMANGGTFFAMN